MIYERIFQRIVALTVATGTFTACVAEPPSEQTATLEQSVSNGSPARDPQFEFVARIAKPGSYCTASLVTPVWVLTANHCITGKTNPISSTVWGDDFISAMRDYVITFAEDAQIAAPIDVFALTGNSLSYFDAQSGPVRVRIDDRVDEFSAFDTSRDIALLRLPFRIPKALIAAKHPQGLLGTRRCRAVVEGTNVGYGKTSLSYDFLFKALESMFGGGGANFRRNRNTSRGWEAQATGPGESLYHNDWLILPILDVSTFYDGIVFGDSGGPMLDGDALCGVNSRFLPVFKTIFDIPYIASEAADLGSAENEDFLTEHLIDERGAFMGECPPDVPPTTPGYDVDSDNDYLPDACDPCPFVPDENYRLTGRIGAAFQDTDGDGVADICDNCAAKENPRQIIVTGPSTPPVFRQPDTDVDGVGDACDSCPSSDVVGAIQPALRSDEAGCEMDADCPGVDNFCVPAAFFEAIPLFLPAHCAVPRDSDRDGIADNCDNCPAPIKNADQTDTDGDGVGDACDNCPGLQAGGPDPRDKLSPASCTFLPGDPGASNAACTGLHPDGTCVPPHPINGDPTNISPARCSHGLDPDEDGLANFCDGCPNIANPLEFGVSQPNCNLESELANGIPYPGIPDACDPTPCAEVVGASTEASSFADMSYHPRILPEGVPGAFDYEGAPTATVGGRFCRCLVQTLGPTGVLIHEPLTPRQCRLSGDCPFGNAMLVYDDPEPDLFVPVTLRRNATSPPTPNSEFTGLRFGAALGHEVPPGGDLVVNETFRFQWDVSTLPTETFPELGRVGTQGVMGVYWAHVKEVPELRFPGTTVAVAPSVYRNLSNNYTSGFFGSVGADPPFTNDPVTVPTACCNRLICGGPCPSCDPFGSGWLGFRDPSQPGNVDTWITQPGGLVDLSPRLPPSVRVGLNDPGLRWEFLVEQLTPARSDRAFGVGFRPDTLEVVSAVAGSLAAPSLTQAYRQTPFTTPSLAVYAMDSLRINDRVEVRRPNGSMAAVAAAGEANIGGDAKVGELASGGTVVLRNRAEVSGTLRATGSIDQSFDAVVRGVEVPGAELALPDLAALSLEFPPAIDGDIDLQPDQTLSLAPGSYGSVSLKSGTLTTLQSGRYFLRSLVLEPDSVMRFDSAEGPVYLYVEESFTYRGTFADERGRHDQLFVGYFGAATAAIDRPFSGTLVAPNAAINLASVDPAGPGHRGSFFGKEVEVHQGSILWHYPFTHPWDLGAIEPEAAARRFGPAPRTDYGAVMSATEQSLFVVGGRLEDGTAARDIWQHTLSADATAGGRWVRLGVEGTLPETVLAATYRAEDRGLYVLDRIDGDLARLLHYGLVTGISTVLASFPLDGGFTRFELGNAPNGGLSLFTSQPGEGATHCVATFVPSGGSIGSISGLLGAGELGGGSCITPAGLVLGLSDPTHPTRLSLSATLASELSFTSGFDINQCL